jgi:hypothetical protein
MFYVQICISSYFAYMDDDNSNKIQFELTVFIDYPGPCFPNLIWIVGALLYLSDIRIHALITYSVFGSTCPCEQLRAKKKTLDEEPERVWLANVWTDARESRQQKLNLIVEN